MSFRKLVEQAMAEDSPPGFKGTVKAMKKHGDIDNPYALAWWMKNKGYQSRKNADGTVKESIRVSHGVHGTGIVESIGDKIAVTWDGLEKRITAPSTLAFEDAKYLTVLEAYDKSPVDNDTTSDVDLEGDDDIDDGGVGDSVASAATAVATKGKKLGEEEMHEDDELDIVSIDDLLEEDDEWQKPWEEDRDEDPMDDNDQHGLRDAEDTRTYDGADYTNVPRPSDSVLTNQEDQPEYTADPLSTMSGYDAAPEGDEVDGDTGDDLPPDAPAIPDVRELDGTNNRHNTRNAGDDSDDTSEVSAGDYDESKPEDNGEDDMKKNEAFLSAEDLGLTLNEMDMDIDAELDAPMDNASDVGMNEHEMGGEEVAVTCDFMEMLLSATAAQSPDEAKVRALCDGLKAAQQEKGDMALDASDWDSIKAAAASAYSGGGDDMGGDDYESDMDECGGGMNYEDKAPGDGDPAGAEGGSEHEGKTKMMDRHGMAEKKMRPGEYENDDYAKGEKVKRRKDRPAEARGKMAEKKMRPGEYEDDNYAKGEKMTRKKPKKSQQHEAKGGTSGTPVGTGNTSGSGGGGQHDLSKPKSYKGKPLGTGTSGPGGSSADEFGQKPHKDGGSNNVPEYESGSQHGAADNPFSKGSPAPRNSKPLAAEARKRKGGKTKLDEAIMLGMSSIPGTARMDTSVPEDADWEDEIKSIKRLSGMENWWE